jgi:hypothetical protein
VMAWNGLGNVYSLSFGHQVSSQHLLVSSTLFAIYACRVGTGSINGNITPKRNRPCSYYSASRQFGILSTALWRFCKKSLFSISSTRTAVSIVEALPRPAARWLPSAAGRE